MKKAFLRLFSALFFTSILLGSSCVINKRSNKNSELAAVQDRVIQNITDTESFLSFAENCLKEYTDTLYQIRSTLVTNGKSKTLASIDDTITKLNTIIEEARFNSVSVFYDEEGTPSRDIPITLTADDPTIALHLSCTGFARQKLTEYQNEVHNSLSTTSDLIDGIDKIILNRPGIAGEPFS